MRARNVEGTRNICWRDRNIAAETEHRLPELDAKSSHFGAEGMRKRVQEKLLLPFARGQGIRVGFHGRGTKTRTLWMRKQDSISWEKDPDWITLGQKPKSDHQIGTKMREEISCSKKDGVVDLTGEIEKELRKESQDATTRNDSREENGTL